MRLLKNSDDFHVDFVTGEMHRTPLHVACLLGDDPVTRCLLRFGANAGRKDRDGDTPLHLAAKYVGEEGNYSDHKLLIDPLIKEFPDAIHMKNKWGETPSQILQEAKEKHKQFLEEESMAWGEEIGSCYKPQEEANDSSIGMITNKSWNEKLANEWEDDCADQGFSQQYFIDKEWANNVPDYPTFEQWADRMAAEYKRKYPSASEKLKRRKEENRKRKFAEIRDMTDRLEKEQEKYRKRMAIKKSEVLDSKHKNYKEKMSKHVSNQDSLHKLRFRDIPWPCHGNVKEMTEVIMRGFVGDDRKERRKYILKQQILWHPDKFMQRCIDMLDDRDKESILQTVKVLSQSLNELLNQ
ncbi:unnamed protein product [Clavelina lepadiformis]|uniref:NF-kappa-B inhibitor-like protein 1 n=1 Tax=Clavelina lepadiformis TaxID=159417 RepID=A0ABP0F8G6_CLALP